MQPLVNDRWRGAFNADEVGRYVYTLIAWVDRFKSWRRDLRKKAEVGAHAELDMRVGAQWIEAAAGRAVGVDAKRLADWAQSLTRET